MENKTLSELSVSEFASELASKKPVPGGGGAAALTGALAAALSSMVGEYTVGKKKYAQFEPELIAAMEECSRLREELISLIERDAAAFEPLSRAYSIPKDAPDRASIMETCLKNAAEAPAQMLRVSCRVVELSELFSEKGSVMMLSDAGCSAALAKAAIDSAALNVAVNTKSMADREYAARLDAEMNEKREKYGKLADKVFNSMLNRLK